MNTPNEKVSIDMREKFLSYWRQRAIFVIVAGLAAVVALAIALLLPPTYRAMGTILIEQQEIPQDMVRSVITSYADQRVQIISQRVMTTQNLLSLIERYDLYPVIREKKPREVLLAAISEEATRQQARIAELDKTLAAFKEKHHDELPELAQINIQAAERTDLDL